SDVALVPSSSAYSAIRAARRDGTASPLVHVRRPCRGHLSRCANVRRVPVVCAFLLGIYVVWSRCVANWPCSPSTRARQSALLGLNIEERELVGSQCRHRAPALRSVIRAAD